MDALMNIISSVDVSMKDKIDGLENPLKGEEDMTNDMNGEAKCVSKYNKNDMHRTSEENQSDVTISCPTTVSKEC